MSNGADLTALRGEFLAALGSGDGTPAAITGALIKVMPAEGLTVAECRDLADCAGLADYSVMALYDHPLVTKQLTRTDDANGIGHVTLTFTRRNRVVNPDAARNLLAVLTGDARKDAS